MPSIYVDFESGNDSNNGRSKVRPVKTLWRVNQLTSVGGYDILLKSDQRHFGNFVAPVTNNKNVIGFYGSGKKPQITTNKIIKNNSWIVDSGNVWKVDLTDNTKFTGDLNTINTNIGHILVNSVVFGDKKILKNQLSKQWDFWCDTTFLYVYSNGNPGSIFSNIVIEAAPNLNAISILSNHELYDIDIIGSGAHGIDGANVQNIVISNVGIKNIGGSFKSDGFTRYGNGIQFYKGGKNIFIGDGCSIEQCYDVAYTLQGEGTTGGAGIGWDNITFQDSLIRNNTQSLEFWVKEGVTGFTNCQHKNLICEGAGNGWGYPVRFDKDSAVHILFYEMTSNGNLDISIENCLFSDSKKGLYYASTTDIPAIKSKNNFVILQSNQNIRSGNDNYKIENFNSFVSATGLESGTRFSNKQPLDTINSVNDVSKITLDRVLLESTRTFVKSLWKKSQTPVKSLIDDKIIDVNASPNTSVYARPGTLAVWSGGPSRSSLVYIKTTADTDNNGWQPLATVVRDSTNTVDGLTSIPVGGTYVDVVFTGAFMGMHALASSRVSLGSVEYLTAVVVATDTVRVFYKNNTASTITLPAGKIDIRVT